MKATQTLLLALAASGVAGQDAPCTNEACTSLCRITPSCLSTLFDPETGLCYTFSCVLNNYSKPSKFLGYQKPGADYECPEEQPVPGEPTSPPPDLVVSTEAPPSETSTDRIGGASSTLSTHARQSTGATATDGSPSQPTDSTSDNGPDSPGDAADGGDDDEDPAAPTIDLPDAAGQLGFPAAMMLLPLALLF